MTTEATTTSELAINLTSRAAYYRAMQMLRGLLTMDNPFDDETMHSLAAIADAASAGFTDDPGPDASPLELATASEFNDARINERARGVYMLAMDKAREMLDGAKPMNADRLSALARACDAAACGFQNDDDNGGD